MQVNEVLISEPGGTATERHLPGEVGIWIFILGDMLVFSLFFLVFMYYRGHEPVLFTESQALLNQHYGVLNTLLMLSSSWFVVLGVQSVRANMSSLADKFFLGGFCCGLAFGVVKFFEWGEKISDDITLTTNDFFMYYYMLTGIHFLHVIIGMGVLIFLWNISRRDNHNKKDISNVESGASYWHMVDLLWIALFPLLYLVK